MRGDTDFSLYAVGRWETLVRTVVLLGVPPSAATPVAAEAIARARQRVAGDDAADDPDVELFAELIEAHRRDRRAWWSLPPTIVDTESREVLGPVEDALDRLSPGVRARVVLEAVAQLPPEQLDRIVPIADGRRFDELVSRTAAAARAVPVVPTDLASVQAAAALPPRGRQLTSGIAIAVMIALALLVGTSVASRLGTGDEIATGRTGIEESQAAADLEADLARVDSAGTYAGTFFAGGSAAPWYAGGVLHLGTLDVPLAGVADLDTVPDGVVVTTEAGRLSAVDVLGHISRIARVVPGSEVAASSIDGVVAYIEARVPRAVTVFDSRLDEVVARVPADDQAEVVAVDGQLTYLNDSDGHFVTGPDDAVRRTNGVTVLDAAGGVLAIAGAPGEVRLVRDGTLLLSTAGDAVDLSPGGRFALIRRFDEQRPSGSWTSPTDAPSHWTSPTATTS